MAQAARGGSSLNTSAPIGGHLARKPGPKPKPTAAKRAAGNPGQRPLNDNEPKAPPRWPACPQMIRANPTARKEWNRLKREMQDAGVITTWDLPTLTAYCFNFAVLTDAAAKLETTGGSIVKTKSGYPIMNPYLTIAWKSIKQLIAVGTEMGLSPSSRTRLNTTPPEKPDPDDARYGI